MEKIYLIKYRTFLPCWGENEWEVYEYGYTSEKQAEEVIKELLENKDFLSEVGVLKDQILLDVSEIKLVNQ